MNYHAFSFIGRSLHRVVTGVTVVVVSMAAMGANSEVERRQQYLEDSLKINRPGTGRYPMTTRLDRTWADWQERTGELPPDFSQMPSEPFLPDPLTLRTSESETAITTPEQWEEKRADIREKFQYWVSGSVPPAPDNLEATILEDGLDGDVQRQVVELRFGPDQKGTLTLELLIPPGDEQRPVYLTQWNHRDWAQLALRRGYIACIYNGSDGYDDTEAYKDLYPEYEFSRLMRRAWGASRAVDYLLTRPQVHPDKIVITGHSRNGKQSLWAAAFDERIGAVVTSSCGTGGIMPWRYSDPQYTNETLDTITGIANTWFHPRLRFFFGREDKLPVEQNELLALIAPRPLLMHFSYMERQSNVWAAEQNYQSIKKVYEFLGEGDNISMLRRGGEHAVAARHQERTLDFLDVKFGRRDVPWDFEPVFDYDFEKWAAEHEDDRTSAAAMEPVVLTDDISSIDQLNEKKQEILEKLDWLLGDEPPGATPRAIAPTVDSRVDWQDNVTGRPEVKGAEVVDIGPYTAMGDHLAGKLYVPEDKDGKRRTAANGKVPVIIYLHQYSYAHGYAQGYSYTGGRGSSKLFQKLVDGGFAVLAIDMFGFGTRLEEARHFYDRIPGWSKMGKMVNDVSAVVDAVEAFDYLDQDRIYVLGDTIGGAVGMIAAARDTRIDGLATMAAFSPWRTSNDRYESIRVYSHQHGFMPRLGFYADKPETVPVDFGEIMATIAPRPMMVIQPELNRHADPDAVTDAMEPVKHAYEMHGEADKLRFETPREINRLTIPMQEDVVKFFQGLGATPEQAETSAFNNN